MGGRTKEQHPLRTEGEVRNISKRELASLVRDNLTTEIINPLRYKEMFGDDDDPENHGESFSKVRFHPIEVVRVKVPDLPKPVLLIVDGHHRARGLNKHFDAIMQRLPGFVPQIHDITALLLWFIVKMFFEVSKQVFI